MASKSEHTSQVDFKASYDTLHSTFATGRTKSIQWRKWQLKQLWWMMVENEDRIIEALHQEMNRPAFETIGMELRSIKADVVEFLEHVDEWAEGEKPDAGFLMGTVAKAWLRKEPLGVALIIAAWNFPLYTLLSPAIAAIGAGKLIHLPLQFPSTRELRLVVRKCRFTQTIRAGSSHTGTAC